jgi:hypothetical protein
MKKAPQILLFAWRKIFLRVMQCVDFSPEYLPMIKELPQSSSPAEWIAGFNELYANSILFIYVPPQAYSPDLFSFIAQTNVKVIGISSPLPKHKPSGRGPFGSMDFHP